MATDSESVVVDLSPILGQALSSSAVADEYVRVRRTTEQLCEPLEIEDYGLQSMPEASPVKWHLAHSTWFFETFVLKAHGANYRPHRSDFEYLFNSYYNAVGSPWPRARRGLLSRPTVSEVYAYRKAVDDAVCRLLHQDCSHREKLIDTITLGLNHEQQHQELILTDLKHALAQNPLRPVYRPRQPKKNQAASSLSWVPFPEGIYWIGHEGPGFAFDNESPRHRQFLQHFSLASRLITNQEYQAFIADDGYARPQMWLSDGWAVRQAQGWTAPLYWHRRAGEWEIMTLGGIMPLEPTEPVCHVSYYEADAFARWAGARLPTEAEWEVASSGIPLEGHFLEGGAFHPEAVAAAQDSGPLFQMFGDVWQWTASPYIGYPGYRPARGALGEYNGKFMCNQLVLRGASCATPRTHARRTYRNFFLPEARWQFTGIRLAQELT
jgi:ergothioneine biosynthesis protein EgtB